MSIALMYNQTAVTYRQTYVPLSSIKQTFTSQLSSFQCHVQPLEATLSENLAGSFGKNWLMFCPVADVKEGDKVVVSGTDEYRVVGVETFNFGLNPHLEVTMRAFKE